MIALLVTTQLAIWGLTQRQALVPRSAMPQQQQQDMIMSHNQQAVQQEPHIWKQHVLLIGVHVETAALALATGAHPTRILGPPQQYLPYLLHSCLHTHQLQIEGEIQGGRIDWFMLQWRKLISSQKCFCDLYLCVA